MQPSTTHTYLIVDDENLARKELCRQICLLLPSFKCIEAGNVIEARSLLLKNQVDGVFLDLEMPGEHGMTFLPEVCAMRIPVVITTAHERFALEAFDVDVTDYLLKPFETSRLARALGRLRQPPPAVDPNVIVLGDINNCWPLRFDGNHYGRIRRELCHNPFKSQKIDFTKP